VRALFNIYLNPPKFHKKMQKTLRLRGKTPLSRVLGRARHIYNLYLYLYLSSKPKKNTRVPA
jgi:hypothetical protein